MFVLDSHCDTPSMIYRLRDITRGGDAHAHVDFHKLREGGVDASFFAAYVPNSLAPDAATRYALQLIARTRDALACAPDLVAPARNATEALSNKAAGLTSIFLGLENGSPIQEDLGLLRLFYDLGVRYMTLTHAGNNQICDSCATVEKKWHGLSPFGREVVAEMNRLGMLIDVSHISDESFRDVLKYSEKPVVATHSCCRALASHPRNMTDEMIREMSEKGGVIQINFFPCFLDDSFWKVYRESELVKMADDTEDAFIADPANESKRNAWYAAMDALKTLPRPSFTRIVDHIDHAVKVGGIDHVGIGSDFDGISVTPEGMEDVSMIGKVFDEMSRRGYRDSEIEKVAGGNFLRVLSAQD